MRRRIRRHLQFAQDVRREPRRLLPWLRAGFLRLWQARGGGLYGLGYVVAFLYLQARMFVGEVEGSDSLLGFVGTELLTYVLRLGYMSLVNGILALLWPLFVVHWFGLWGLAGLAAGYFGFEKLLRPFLEQRLPELRRSPAAGPLPADSVKSGDEPGPGTPSD